MNGLGPITPSPSQPPIQPSPQRIEDEGELFTQEEELVSEEETELPAIYSAQPTDLRESLAIQSGIVSNSEPTPPDEEPTLAEREKEKFAEVVKTGESIVSAGRQLSTEVLPHIPASVLPSHYKKAVPSLVETLNVPVESGRIVQTRKEYKAAKEQLKAKREEIASLLQTPVSEERNIQHLALQKEVDALKSKAEKIKNKLLKGSFGVAKSTVKSGTGIATFVGSTLGHSETLSISSAVRTSSLKAVSLASEAVSLVEQGKKYHALSQELQELKAHVESLRQSTEPVDISPWERKIDQVNKKMDELKNSIIENSIVSTGTLAETVGVIAESIIQVAPHIGQVSEAATAVLATIGTAAPIVGEVAGIVLNGKQIADNIITDTALTVEIEKLKRSIGQAAPPIKDILEMKLKNLEFQREENLVATVKNAIALCSGAFGTAGSVIAAVGITTGVVAVAGATAGVAAGFVAGVAIGLGGGYYIYKNRLYLASQAQSTIQQTKQKVLGAQIKVTDFFQGIEQERVQKKVGTLSKERLDTKVQREQVQQEFSARINPLLEAADEKSKALKAVTDLRNALITERDTTSRTRHLSDYQRIQSEIQLLNTEIDVLEKEIQSLNKDIDTATRLASDRTSIALKEEHKVEKEIVKQLEKVNDTNAKMVGLLESRRSQTAKGDELKEKLENRLISAHLNNSSPKEVLEFKEKIKAALAVPAQAIAIRHHLEKQSIECEDEEKLLQNCLDYIVQPF